MNLYKALKKISVLLIVAAFCLGPSITPYYSTVYAQNSIDLPEPGEKVGLSAQYTPATIKGIKIFADNPLKFEFIVDTGEDHLTGESLQKETLRLIRYFMASLTVPEKDLWVNLSPYEENKIIPSSFGLTEMGRDLLSQDYLLKQLTASLIYPEEALGEKFWQGVYDKAYRLYGTKDIPANTFNKVWIIPEKASVHEHGDTVLITDTLLKVMLEGDYLSFMQGLGNKEFGTDQLEKNDIEKIDAVSAEMIRKIILPAIEKEVNEGKNFSALRQIYHSMILATWYKRKFQESLLGTLYLDQNKIEGIHVEDPDIKNKIYERYVEAFQKGVFNYIRDEYDATTQQIISKKYFSGGVQLSALNLDSDQTQKDTAVTVRGVLVRASVGLENENIPPSLRPNQDKVKNPSLLTTKPELQYEKRFKSLGQPLEIFLRVEALDINARVNENTGDFTDLGSELVSLHIYAHKKILEETLAEFQISVAEFNKRFFSVLQGSMARWEPAKAYSDYDSFLIAVNPKDASLAKKISDKVNLELERVGLITDMHRFGQFGLYSLDDVVRALSPSSSINEPIVVDALGETKTFTRNKMEHTTTIFITGNTQAYKAYSNLVRKNLFTYQLAVDIWRDAETFVYTPIDKIKDAKELKYKLLRKFHLFMRVMKVKNKFYKANTLKEILTNLDKTNIDIDDKLNIYHAYNLILNLRLDFEDLKNGSFEFQKDKSTPKKILALIQALQTRGIVVPEGGTSIERLNQLLKSKDLYKHNSMSERSAEINELIVRLENSTLHDSEMIRLNRLLIDANYPLETPKILKNNRWAFNKMNAYFKSILDPEEAITAQIDLILSEGFESMKKILKANGFGVSAGNSRTLILNDEQDVTQDIMPDSLQLEPAGLSSDNAMIDDTVGGINLNPKLFELESSGESIEYTGHS